MAEYFYLIEVPRKVQIAVAVTLYTTNLITMTILHEYISLYIILIVSNCIKNYQAPLLYLGEAPLYI